MISVPLSYKNKLTFGILKKIYKCSPSDPNEAKPVDQYVSNFVISKWINLNFDSFLKKPNQCTMVNKSWFARTKNSRSYSEATELLYTVMEGELSQPGKKKKTKCDSWSYEL